MDNQSPQFQSYLGLQKIINSSYKLQSNIEQIIELQYKINGGVKNIKLLDTFFSDTLEINTLKLIFEASKQLNCCVQILMLDPTSQFAKSRANAISQSSIAEINNALYKIRCGLNNKTKNNQPLDRNKKDGFEKYDYIFEQLEIIRSPKNDVRVSIRFYDVLTESPIYIFSPFVLKGLILHRMSAAENPWLFFIDDSSQSDDIFEYLNNNFDTIWNGALDSPVMKNNDKGIMNTGESPNVFIAHGHDHGIRRDLKNYLQNTLKFKEPILLNEQASQGKTIIEKFEHFTEQTNIAFVILTADDLVKVIDDGSEYLQPRPNALFELGYFYGKLKRKSGKVILLCKDKFKMPLDLIGICSIDVSDGVEKNGEEIRRELKPWLRL